MDKGHGRFEPRAVWVAATDPKAMGWAGVAPVVRLQNHTQVLRQGRVIKTSEDTRLAVTSYRPRTVGSERLLAIGRAP